MTKETLTLTNEEIDLLVPFVGKKIGLLSEIEKRQISSRIAPDNLLQAIKNTPELNFQYLWMVPVKVLEGKIIFNRRFAITEMYGFPGSKSFDYDTREYIDSIGFHIGIIERWPQHEVVEEVLKNLKQQKNLAEKALKNNSSIWKRYFIRQIKKLNQRLFEIENKYCT